MSETQTTEVTKYCQYCEQRKVLSAFREIKSLRDGRVAVCKECEIQRHRDLKAGILKPDPTERVCIRCEVKKPITEFWRNKKFISSGLRGYNAACKSCMNQRLFERANMISVSEKKCTVCKETKQVAEFDKVTRSVDGYNQQCKACSRWKTIFKKYGVTKAQYEEIFMRQNGLCAICHKPSLEMLCIDHSHTSGIVRELLCSKCNTGIGMFFENVEFLKSAIAYVERHHSNEK